MIDNTYIFNPVRPDFIARAIETLKKFTPGNNKIIVVDQTRDGIYDLVKKDVHLYLRPHRNLGFSKSMNEGIIHGLRWGSKYITCANDDLEFMDSRWWDGIVETFQQDEKILAVNPMSPKEPGWGYGLPHGVYFELIPYKKEFSKEDYDFLLAGDFTESKQRFNTLFEQAGRPNTFPDKKHGVIDGIATWCTVFKNDCFDLTGLFEEKYYPGGGEDYDMNARAYQHKMRMVGTTKSWVWHHWGSSKDEVGTYHGLPILEEYRWMNPDALWPPDKNLAWKDGKYQPKVMDPWARLEQEDGSFKPMYRVEEVGVVEI